MGELLSKLLDDEGIAHHPIKIGAMTRENVTVFEESSGQQFRLVMPGGALTDEEVQTCLDRLQKIDPPPEYLVLSGSLPAGVDEGLYARIAGAVAPSCKVVLDTSGGALELALESAVYLIKPNIGELEQLAGHPIEDDAQLRKSADSLVQEDTVEVVVTSLGSGGVVLTTAEGHRHIPAPTVKIRSKVGAGDSTVGGIVHALTKGKSILEAVCFGVAAGSAAVMTEGTELCRRKDVERLYQTVSQTMA
jgi:6-phosphofructokinase 2